MDQCLDIGRREVSFVLTCESSGHIDGRQGHVEVESEHLFLSGLAVNEAGILLAVSQQEHYLKLCPIDVHEVLCLHLRVCGDEHLPVYLLRPAHLLRL